DIVERYGDTGPADADAARAAIAAAPRQQVGIALDVAHVLDRHPEALRDEIRHRRFEALADTHDAGIQGDGAVARNADRREILAGFHEWPAGHLDRIGDAEPAQLAALCRFGAARFETCSVGDL